MKRFLTALTIMSIALVAAPLSAQHAAFRVKGYVRDDKGAPIANADVHVEAFYGYFAGAFGGGQRTFSTRTNAKGDWNIGALQPGVWLFEVFSPNYVPETVLLPIRILTTGQHRSGRHVAYLGRRVETGGRREMTTTRSF
jgi:hypothetical protein